MGDNKKSKAVIFDLDGTLLNTLEDLADSMNEALSRNGFPAHSIDDYKYFIGNGIDVLARKSLPERNRDEDTVKSCISAMLDIYGRRWAEKTEIYDGIPALLKELTTANIKTAVLSNKMDDFTRLMVSTFFKDHRFDAVFGQRPSFPKKPDPAGAIEIAGLLGIKPADILYVGDSDIDMLTANSAGMLAVGVVWGFRPAAELLANGAKVLLEKPQELLKHI